MSQSWKSPDTVFETVGKIVNISNYTGAVGIVCINGKYKVFWGKCLFINITVYFLNFIYTAVRAYQSKKYDPNVRHFQAAYGFVIISLVEYTLQTLFIPKSPELASLLNTFLKWFTEFQDLWFKPSKKRSKWNKSNLEISIIIYSLMSLGASIVLIPSHFLLFPDTPYYLSTSFSQSNPSYFWIQVIAVLWTTFISQVFFCTMMAIISIVSVYFMSIFPLILNEFRADQPTYKTLAPLRSPMILTSEYRKLELMHKFAIEVVGIIILPIHTLTGHLVLFANYSLIANWGIFDPTQMAIVVYGSIAWLFVLEIAGYFTKQSKVTLNSWRRIKSRRFLDLKYLKKFGKCCKPLKVGTKGYFSISRLSSLKFIRAVIKGTFRALLTLK